MLKFSTNFLSWFALLSCWVPWTCCEQWCVFYVFTFNIISSRQFFPYNIISHSALMIFNIISSQCFLPIDIMSILRLLYSTLFPVNVFFFFQYFVPFGVCYFHSYGHFLLTFVTFNILSVDVLYFRHFSLWHLSLNLFL